MDKLMFFGIEDNDDSICIEFVRTYSRDAHESLAFLGYAPALRGFEKIPGAWLMVVMDMLPDDFEMLSESKDRLSPSAFANLLQAVNSLHNAGFVHGDIRDTNTMVCKTDETKFMIIDFDWAGKIGEARYPANVNHVGIERPKDALDGFEILTDHDEVIQRNRFS